MPVLNFNVGVLGHVDSGKTSLAKALSTIASTNAFDKNPQSQERGITLDLGFSSFSLDIPTHLIEILNGKHFDQLQITLVDCPGHASLIRTIIGGAQIIDLMLLVIDITKGIQTQTAECLVIGEITCDRMLVVLNKIDLIDESQRQSTIDKMTKRLRKTFESTKFAQAPIVACSAIPPLNLNELVSTLQSCVYIPQRSSHGPFVFSVDHCFSIRGQGTVMTGTVLSGAIRVNDSIEIAALKEVRKIKSMQMFRKPIEQAMQGDRVGICVTQFDPDRLERGLVSTPGVIKIFHAFLIRMTKVRYFKNEIESRSKFHITCGHSTVMGKIILFADRTTTTTINNQNFDFEKEYEAIEQFPTDESSSIDKENIYALIELETTVTCQLQSILIGSRLDTNIHVNTCRLAFYGHVLDGFTDAEYANKDLPTKLRIYKRKEKTGLIDRVVDSQTLIGKDLFSKETNINAFVNFKVQLTPSGEQGFIESSFGQSGKFKVRFINGLSNDIQQMLTTSKGRKQQQQQQAKMATTTDNNDDGESNPPHERIRIVLKFKKYLFQDKTTICQ